MMRNRRMILPCLMLLLFMAGCSGDDVSNPGQNGQSGTSMVRGEFSDGMTDFEFMTETNNDRQPGPFIVRGTNLHYDDDLGALVVDLIVINATENDYPEPISMTFMQLLPDSVTVENADNEETGPGAAILFQFENTDGVWTPREFSIPRTVQFGVDSGVSIGFVARIDVGMNPNGGAIGGIVWHDVNEDGVIDSEEEGIAEVGIALFGESTEEDPIRRTETMEDGSFRFDGLDAGFYTVMKLPRDDLRPTTSPHMQVLLVEQEGEVSDFLMANFGCVMEESPEDPISVGDIVIAKGEYADEPDRLVAHRICWCSHEYEENDCEEEEEEEENDDKCCPQCWGRLVGPVTAINLDDHALAVMGTWVIFEDDEENEEKHELDLDEVELGDRVRVKVTLGEDDQVYGCRLNRWEGHWDWVRGRIQEIIYGEEDRIRAVRVLNTLIQVDDREIIRD